MASPTGTATLPLFFDRVNLTVNALTVVTALWQRPALATVVLGYYVGLGLDVVAVRSPEDPDPAPDVSGVRYVEAPNAPLSDKWNVAMRALPQGRAALVVGSDDLVAADYLARAVRWLGRGLHLVRATEIAFVDTATGRAMACRPSRLGGGRVLSPDLLGRLDYAPWPPGLDRRLDGAMDVRLRRVGHTRADEIAIPPHAGPQVLAPKSGVQMWDFDSQAAHRVRTLTAREVHTLTFTRFPTLMSATFNEKIEARLADLHKGGGYYAFSEDDVVRGKEKAAKRLRESMQAEKAERAAKEKHAQASEPMVPMRAQKNLLPEWIGREAGSGRVFRDESFEAPDSIARKLAKSGRATEITDDA